MSIKTCEWTSCLERICPIPFPQTCSPHKPTADPSGYDATITQQIRKALNNSSCLSCVPPKLDTPDDKLDTTNSRGQDPTRPAVHLITAHQDLNVRRWPIPAFLRTSPSKNNILRQVT